MSWYDCYHGDEQLRFQVQIPGQARHHNRHRPEWPRITKIVRRSDGKTWLIDEEGATEIEQMRLGL